jgi:hypothetical protein
MIGEPDAGNPQVRFDERMQETGGNVPRLRPTLQRPRSEELLPYDSVRAVLVRQLRGPHLSTWP